MGFLAELRAFGIGSYGSLAKMFLVCDGTLTDLLEVAVNEEIKVKKISMESLACDKAIAELDVPAGELIIYRKICLQGQESDRNYVYAESLLVPRRLPIQFSRDLLERDEPLGRLWSEYKLETRKEILEYAQVKAGNIGDYLQKGQESSLLMRAYRLISSGRPIIAIREYFPADLAISSKDLAYLGEVDTVGECSSRSWPHQASQHASDLLP